MVFGVGSQFKNSEPYKISFSRVINSQDVESRLESPLDSGFVGGNMHTSGLSGSANIAYSIEGPKGEATVAVEASKKLINCSIDCLVLICADSNDQTVVVLRE